MVRTHYQRRNVLKITGATLTGGIAGCLGGDEPSEGIDDTDVTGEWPPERNLVEFISGDTAGSIPDIILRLWAEELEHHLPGGVTTAATSMPPQIQCHNTVWNGEPDGSLAGILPLIPLLADEIEIPEQVDYTPSEFSPIGLVRLAGRGIQINHVNTPIDDHWQWDWETFVEHAIEDDYRAAISAPAQRLFIEFLKQAEPRLEDIGIISFPSGSEARAAMQRGDGEIRVGSVGSNYIIREDFYKTQFALADERYPDLIERYENIVNPEDSRYLEEGDGPTYIIDGMPDEDGARLVADMSVTGALLSLPPDTPEDLVDIHVEAFKSAATNEEFVENFESAAGDGTFVGDAERARPFLDDKIAVFNDNEELISDTMFGE